MRWRFMKHAVRRTDELLGDRGKGLLLKLVPMNYWETGGSTQTSLRCCFESVSRSQKNLEQYVLAMKCQDEKMLHWVLTVLHLRAIPVGSAKMCIRTSLQRWRNRWDTHT